MTRVLLLIFFLITYSCKQNHTNTTSLPNNKSHEKANEFRDNQISDSAFYYYSLAKDEYLLNKDSSRAAQAIINMAIIQSNSGDYFGSIETSLEADTLLAKKKDSISKGFLAANYNNLAVASNGLKNYDEAEKFYKLALKNVVKLKNKFVYYNNIGDVLITKGDYKSAIPYLQAALKSTDSVDYARAINNWARAKYLENQNFNPLPFYEKALNIRYKIDNKLDLNSSFANLSDYYNNKDKSIALDYAKKMESAAIAANSLPDQLQAFQRIILLDSKNYQKNFQKFTSLNDEIQLGLNRAKNQFALIRYGVEKSKAENSILKVDKLESQRKLILLVFAIIGLITIIIISTISYKKRRKRLEQEKELLKQEKQLEVKNTELKYSKRVHDVVANGIYQIMTKLENYLDISRDETLDDLEYVYNRSRNISYDNPDKEDQSEVFTEKISKMLSYFKNEKVNTILIGNDVEVWEGISDTNKAEVYQVLRELLINMKKHSKADRVTLRFERTLKEVKFFYSDTGIGISSETILKNGTRNMVNRIENMGGNIIFETQTEKGLEVNFSIPVS